MKRGEADDGEGAEGNEGEQLGLPELKLSAVCRGLSVVGGTLAGAADVVGDLARKEDGAEVAGGDGAEDGEREECNEP